MKLNPNCIRDILLYLEEHLVISPELEYQEVDSYQLAEHLEYAIQEIVNTLLVLRDANFIILSVDDSLSNIDVYRITYNGYQFIESIRPKSVWDKTLSVSRRIGSFSLDLISQVAHETLSAMIPVALSAITNVQTHP